MMAHQTDRELERRIVHYASERRGRGHENVPKEQLDKLHSPVFYISGDSTDIAFANSNDDFKRITKVPAFRAYKDGVGHGGTYTQPNGGDFGKVAVALLEWQFKGDQQASKMFWAGIAVSARIRSGTSGSV
jgi:hypothetical protein